MAPSDARTLIELLERRAGCTPGQPAFLWDDRPHSFEELWRAVSAFACVLQGLGVARGDRVLIALANGPEFFTAFYGAMRAGGIAVPVYPASGPDRIAAMARLCGAKILVAADANSRVAGVRTISVGDGTTPATEAAMPEVAPTDIAFLQYTSGSTGSPKGVMLSHEGLLTNVRQLIDGMKITAADCFVSWLPVYHDMGLILMTMVPFYLGAKLVLLPTALANARPWLTAIARHRGTLTASPDFGYRVVLRHVKEPAAYDLSTLRLALNAAEPVRPRTIEAFEQAFGLRHVLIAGYGLAEATVGVSTWQPGEPPLVDARGIVSVGRPFAGIDVRIIEDEEPVAAGRVGEVVVRSPANTRGYYSDERETARLFWRDAYIRTGDLGYLDEEGRLFVTGRLKNIIKHGGETVFPQEAEQIADLVPLVRRSAAVGIDSGGSEGEQLYLFAEVARPSGYDDEKLYDAALTLVQAIHSQLGIRPGRVYLLRPHAIPLTHNGKTRHRALHELYVSGRLRADNAILFPHY